MYNITPQLADNGITVAELFCGGGLMAVGLKSAGFDLVWANDFEKTASKAYAHNIGEHVVCGDITDTNIQRLMPEADIIAGGPPCQDYSIAGNGEGEDGERGKLVFIYLSIIWMRQPKAFIFENVKGLIQKKHRHTFDALIQQMEFIGYRISWKLINSWDYGVAQKRERVFIVGIREDLGFEFEFPEPKAEDYRTQVLRDVIGDLPHMMDTVGSNVKSATHKADMNEPSPVITTQFRCQSVHIKNHDEKSFWFPKSEYTYDQANRTQSMDEPCNTIPAHHNSGQPIHPTQAPRRFTVRECLRIQSVPDWYIMPEGMALGPQYKIVGNGVASKVAYDLGKALAEQLRAAE